jgi:hypothetical protein
MTNTCINTSCLTKYSHNSNSKQSRYLCKYCFAKYIYCSLCNEIIIKNKFKKHLNLRKHKYIKNVSSYEQNCNAIFNKYQSMQRNIDELNGTVTEELNRYEPFSENSLDLYSALTVYNLKRLDSNIKSRKKYLSQLVKYNHRNILYTRLVLYRKLTMFNSKYIALNVISFVLYKI